MNEHEKMLNGKWYDANFDENLLSIRYKVKSLCDELNYRIPHEDKEERNEVIAVGAVVKNDIPDNSLVAGVPAKIIRTINQLERLDLE